jgi:hypothetical protein
MDKHSGKVHVWAAISFLGKVCIRVFTNNNNAAFYCSLLDMGFRYTADSMYGGPGTWVYQHDNSPIHTAIAVRNHLESQGFSVLDWPSKSPDLNPIENLWHLLKQRVRKRLPQNTESLTQCILEEWSSLDDQTVSNLCASIHSRLIHCVRARGGPIQY